MSRRRTLMGAATTVPLLLFCAAAGATVSTAHFVDSMQSLGGETGNGVALGDLDGDGDVDAFVANDVTTFGEANQVWLNDGLGGFSQGPTLGEADGTAVALGDLDGDGDLDAVVTMPAPGSATVWLNQGGVQGGTEGDFGAAVPIGEDGGYGVALGDIDDDGDLDALLVGNANQVWLNDGSGTLTAGPQLAFLFSEAVVLADLDGDGWLDAVIADSASGSDTRVWWNDGNWDPGPGSFTASDPLPTDNLINAVAVGRLDGDDRPDIFLAGSGPDQIYWNDGSRTFSTTGPLAVSDNTFALALGDIDDDGLLDAVTGNINADPNRVWRNQGGRTFTVVQEFGDELSLSWSRGLGLADLNGDGMPDLFDVTTAADRVWLNRTASGPSQPAWQIQTVAQRGRTGLGSSIALDAAGRPHVTWVEYVERRDAHDFRLFHAAWDGQRWVTSAVVDTASAMATATRLALDSQDRPHIAYQITPDDTAVQRVRYAFWDGSEWQHEPIAENTALEVHLSLALDAQDQPHVTFYQRPGEHLAYARRAGAQWQVEVVDQAADVGRFNSLAVDAGGNPHVAYHDSTAGELKYGTRTAGGPWQVSVIDDADGYASLALDSAGRPHVGYIGSGAVVRYGRYDGNAWQLETVALTGDFEHPVLAVDANDQPHLIWNLQFSGDVRYGRRSGGGWMTEIAATSPSWGGHDLAVGADLTPHVSFHHGDYGDLRYGILDEPWRVRSIDSPGPVERPSLAIPVGAYARVPELAYYKPPAGLLRHAAWADAMWQPMGVDLISAPGANPSLAIGNDGRARVSYHDADTGQLAYAEWDGAAWQSETVDPTAGTGRFSALLLEGTRPTIAYWDDTTRRIRLAHRDVGAEAWQFTTNDAAPPAAEDSGHLSAARLSDGRIAVSYFRADGGELRLATWDGGSWTDELVATGLSVAAPHNAVAVDAVANEPAVAYYLPSSRQITYAFRLGQTWQSQLAAGGVDDPTGLALQLALESRRQPRIAYATADALRLVSGQDGTWRDELVVEEPGADLTGISFVLGLHQHVAAGSSSGLRYAFTLASSSGPEPSIGAPYDPVAPFLECLVLLFDGGAALAAAVPSRPRGLARMALSDLDIFLGMTPIFRATAGGQYYVDLYAAHVQEATELVLDDLGLLRDAFGTLQNFLPGLEALALGRGDEVLVTQAMVDDALDIWRRLAAAGSPALANAIDAELARYDDLQDFVGLTFAEWADQIGTRAPSACTGDCTGDGAVTIDELVLGVNIALGRQPISRCGAYDTNQDGQVVINELVQAVGAALNGCP